MNPTIHRQRFALLFIAGTYDELRIYDYPLGPTAVRRNFGAGPDKLDVAGAEGRTQ